VAAAIAADRERWLKTGARAVIFSTEPSRVASETQAHNPPGRKIPAPLPRLAHRSPTCGEHRRTTTSAGSCALRTPSV
jgi:hypothetical protein